MKELNKYYVCDALTESVVGSFSALNDAVAKIVISQTLKTNDKVKMIGDNLVVRSSEVFVPEYETFDEVVKNCSYVLDISQELKDNEL